MNRKQLNIIVAYIARSLSSAALMIWGVVNVSSLANEYMKRTNDDGSWAVSAMMCGVFGLLPFAVGSWLLYRNVSSVSTQPDKKTEPAA